MDKKGTSTHLLRSRGLRATPQRLVLMSLLAKANHPMSIPELSSLQGSEALDNTTFYRGLEALTAAGLVRKVNLRHEHTDYELVRDHHHHLVCENCEKIENIDWCPAPSVPPNVLKGSGFTTLSDHAIEFFGLCKMCV